MEYIQPIQTNFGDAFTTLPLLIIGFSFFFGLLTSNTGLIYLFLGHLLVVPALGFLNNTSTPWLKDEKMNYIQLSQWFISAFGVGIVNFAPFSDSAWNIIKYISTPLLLGLQIFSLNKYPPEKVESTGCSIVPGIASEDFIASRPSAWLAHITFFISFVFANAIGIFSEPTPQLVNASTGVTDAMRAKQQRQLDDRVYNRKLQSGVIAGICAVSLILFLVIRYSRTPCEGGFFASLPGLLLTMLTGTSFYTFIYSYCGVRPADVLGIVQGMVNPELLEKPIVCVGEKGN